MTSAELEQRIHSLSVASNKIGEKWLTSALHPPTKSDNPGYPDSDSTASIRTNANVNYTLAPPGYVTANDSSATWSASIISNPNNAYYPGYVVCYATKCFPIVEDLFASTVQGFVSYTQGAQPGSSNTLKFYQMNVPYNVVGPSASTVCFDVDGNLLSTVTPTDSDVAIVFRPIFDSYMPSYDTVTAWRTTGASNTTYLDCAEMYKQGMIYGSHSTRPQNCHAAAASLLPLNGYYEVSNAEMEKKFTTDLRPFIPDPTKKYVGLQVDAPKFINFLGDFEHMPRGAEDTTYTFKEIHKEYIVFSHNLASATNGAVAIVSPWQGWTPSDVGLTVTGHSGSTVHITNATGVVKKVDVSNYINALANNVITGPPAVATSAEHKLYKPDYELFCILNNLEPDVVGQSYFFEVDGDDYHFQAVGFSASQIFGYAIGQANATRSFTTIPLDRQSMQAASTMMQHEAKYGGYQVSRLYDTENPYVFARSANSAQVAYEYTNSNNTDDGSPVSTEVINGLVADFYCFTTKRAPAITPAPLTSIFFPDVLADSTYDGDVVQSFLTTETNNTGVTKWTQTTGLQKCLPSTSAWSVTIQMYIGLSVQTTIQGKICRDLEYIPAPTSPVAALASIGALSDERAIFNGVLLLNALPALMPQSDNDLGSWLKSAWKVVQNVVPKAMPVMEMVLPGSGLVAGTAVELGKSIEKLIKDMNRVKNTVNATKQKADAAHSLAKSNSNNSNSVGNNINRRN